MGNKNCDKSIYIATLKVIRFHLLDCKRMAQFLLQGAEKRLHFILIVPLAIAGSENHLIGSPEEWKLPLIHKKATAVIAVRQATYHQERTVEENT